MTAGQFGAERFDRRFARAWGALGGRATGIGSWWPGSAAHPWAAVRVASDRPDERPASGAGPAEEPTAVGDRPDPAPAEDTQQVGDPAARNDPPPPAPSTVPQPSPEAPGSQSSGAEHPTAQHPTAQHPAAQHPTAQHPAAEHPSAEGPTAQHPAAEHPAAEYPGAQYPGAQYPPPPYPPPDWQHPPPPQARRKRWKVVAIVAVVVLLVAGGIGVGYYFYDRAERTVTLLGPTTPGAEPFGPNLALDGGLLPTAAFDTSSGRTPSGDVEGLYWDTNGTAGCNRAQLSALLGGDPTLATAWALPLGRSAAEVAGFVETLTPVRLRADTRLTAHGYADGRAEPYPATLQAGTAVLVDDRGVPRVRCADASPLIATEAVQDPYYGGEQWPGFEPSGLIEVRPAAAAIREFGLVGVAGDQPFRRPAGTLGPEDYLQVTETGRLNGSYVLLGTQATCEGLVDCSLSAQRTLTPVFSGCPAQCALRELELGEAVVLTWDGSTWRAAGTIGEGYGPTCETRPTPTAFELSITPTAAGVVNGVWTATAVRADYRLTTPPVGICLATARTWTMTGGTG